MLPKLLFWAGLLFCLTPWSSPPLALVLGVLLGLSVIHPYGLQSRKVSTLVLQFCVVGLGFGMNLEQVLEAGRSGFLYTALTIGFALAVGTQLGRIMKVPPTEAFLISVGSAICGGSAIAAVAPVVGAKDEEVSASVGTVFLLNAAALLIFPPIGGWLHLSQQQFGLWAALAIHDTSSVVGAGAKFGAAALAVATTVKLARALWIVPVTLLTAAVTRHKAKIKFPWFIVAFPVAAWLNTYVTAGAPVFAYLYQGGKLGMVIALFLIGSNVSTRALKKVGPRPLLQGVALWIIISISSLALVTLGVIGM